MRLVGVKQVRIGTLLTHALAVAGGGLVVAYRWPALLFHPAPLVVAGTLL